MLKRAFVPGEGIEPNDRIWVITSRSVCIPAVCTDIDGKRVHFKYLDGKAGTVHITEAAVRLVDMPGDDVRSTGGEE